MKNTAFIKITAPEYPDLLRHVYQAPERLYYRGDVEILSGKCIAFVGTRNFTPYGKMVCEKIIEELSLCDLVIVSGLARGIDTIAHKTALSCGLKTIAVLGTGIDNVYPPENLEIADELVARGGCIVSEYPDDEPPMSFHFPMRNRIIAGLSLATVVIEAPESSGALITAKRANEENRDVFAVPADIDRDKSTGCNKLIQDLGAKTLLNGIDIIRELKIQSSLFADKEILKNKSLKTSKEFQQKFGLTEEVSNVLSSIPKTRPAGIEQIAETSGVCLKDINKSLSLLEIHGLVVGTNSGFYLRTV